MPYDSTISSVNQLGGLMPAKKSQIVLKCLAWRSSKIKADTVHTHFGVCQTILKLELAIFCSNLKASILGTVL